MRALDRANEIRLARAEFKRELDRREMKEAETYLAAWFEDSIRSDFPEWAEKWKICEPFMAMNRWGRAKTVRFLGIVISESRPLGMTTVRERTLIAQALRAGRPTLRSPFDGPYGGGHGPQGAA